MGLGQFENLGGGLGWGAWQEKRGSDFEGGWYPDAHYEQLLNIFWKNIK